MSLELTDEEREFFKIGTSKHNHECRNDCFVAIFCDLILKCQAGKMRAEHDLLATEENEIGTHKDCEQCYYSDEQWLDAAQAELSREGKE